MIEARLFAVDTNIVFYAAGFDDIGKRDIASAIMAKLGSEHLIAPTQVLGELYNALVKKGRLLRTEAAARVGVITDTMRVHAAGPQIFAQALDLAATHQLQFWDALILATAADAGCQLLLTEDMNEGFVWRGCTVTNPFAGQLHPLLADALSPR